MKEPTFDDLITADGFVPSEAVADVIGADRGDIRSLMQRLLPFAARRARACVSSFAVGAVVESTSCDEMPGNLYLGANVEFSGLTLGATLHAEQSAINNAWLHGETGIRRIAVTAPPCGHCRQFLNELAAAETLEVVIAEADSPANPSYSKHSLATLLPVPFSPANLGSEVRLLQAMRHRVSVQSPHGEAAQDPLVAAAVAAAQTSYAPYTRNFAGVALATSAGEIVTGRLAENVAFNPTLSPMASALAAWAIRDPGHSGLTAAVLVEVPTTVNQRANAASLLSSVAPDVSMKYLTAELLSM